jgi:arsenate reductase-like glutaredoxin family protein
MYWRSDETDLRRTFSRVRKRERAQATAQQPAGQAAERDAAAERFAGMQPLLPAQLRIQQSIDQENKGDQMQKAQANGDQQGVRFAIEMAAFRYSEARARLNTLLQELEEEMNALRASRMAEITTALAAAESVRDEIVRIVAQNPQEFERPRTIVAYGIKIGYQKGRGSIEWDDDARVCAAIRRHYPDAADTMIRVKEQPVRAALATLPAKDLQRLGVRVIETGDEIVVRACDTDLERAIARILDVEKADARVDA